MLNRRGFCKALAAAPAAMASPMLMRSSFADEVSSIVIDQPAAACPICR